MRLVRVVIVLYYTQAAVGLVAGLAYPWLRFFSVIWFLRHLFANRPGDDRPIAFTLAIAIGEQPAGRAPLFCFVCQFAQQHLRQSFGRQNT